MLGCSADRFPRVTHSSVEISRPGQEPVLSLPSSVFPGKTREPLGQDVKATLLIQPGILLPEAKLLEQSDTKEGFVTK